MDWENPLYMERPEWMQKRELGQPMFLAPDVPEKEEGGVTQSECRENRNDKGL